MTVILYKVCNVLQGQGEFIQFVVISTTTDCYEIIMGELNDLFLCCFL